MRFNKPKRVRHIATTAYRQVESGKATTISIRQLAQDALGLNERLGSELFTLSNYFDRAKNTTTTMSESETKALMFVGALARREIRVIYNAYFISTVAVMLLVTACGREESKPSVSQPETHTQSIPIDHGRIDVQPTPSPTPSPTPLTEEELEKLRCPNGGEYWICRAN